MPNFFVEATQINDTEVRIFGDDAHHIARSLRMAEGDAVTVSDGTGMQYLAVLKKIRDEECIARIENTRCGFGESPVEVTLFMGYPKSDKLEMIVQKATELGAYAIIPFESSRCIKRPSAEKSEKIIQRLSRIVKEAAKQCSRSKIPQISAPITLGELSGKIKDFDLALFCYECAPSENSCRKILESHHSPVRSVAVIVGCEGGFSAEEAELIITSGAKAVSLGERILRCETAPDFILSAISYHFEM